jgi:16S rRNA (uracil1498-N3)-methyltransferase
VPHRFFAPELTPTALEVVLPAGESTHLARVLRLREGDPIEVFDGRGTLRLGIVTRPAPGGAVVSLGAGIAAAPEPPAPLVIVQGLLKGDAMDAVVRDATVLGATELWPVVSSRTNVPARAARAAQDRWERVAVAAAKQCGRAVLPRMIDVRPVQDVMDEARLLSLVRLWLTEPAAAGAPVDVPMPPQGLCLAIGPEGGWAPDEVRAATDAGWQPWTLAPVTLRAEHVTLAALSVVRYAWDGAGRRRIT